ncbi:Hypothetical protein CINCED_3A001126 [Cinara cedri]|uniref:HAT, C-terminal dimerisation domain n=1 Tax=Cinara cedri TaxID=506608 RepID=A0A5E4MQ96_9HEMI|nr:Hypothetical protein CINCED_3A001126 [Cinara cedri]
MFDETAADESPSAFKYDKHKFRVSVYQVVIDTAFTQISARFVDSNKIKQDTSNLDPRHFKRINEDVMYKSYVTAVESENSNSYSDSENDEDILTLCSTDKKFKKCNPYVIKSLQDFNLHSSVSDLFIAYGTLLTLSFIQVSCERSFSKLKIFKTQHRSLIGQDLLESFILINSEADIISKWNYEDIIDEFAYTSNEMKQLLFKT